MLIYGDPGFDAQAGGLLGGLRWRVAGAIRDPGPLQDRVRALLIEAGQVEQAFSDYSGESSGVREIAQATAGVTDQIADALVRVSAADANGETLRGMRGSLETALGML